MRKQSEGIALLSMYNDEEEDEDEMEEDSRDDEVREVEQEQHQRLAAAQIDSTMDVDERNDSSDNAVSMEKSISGVASERLTPTPQHSRVNNVVSPPQQGVAALNLTKGSARGSLNIVDYGHDEVAMSPEPEDKEVEGSSTSKLACDPENTDGNSQNGMPPQFLGHLNPWSNQSTQAHQSDEMEHDPMVESDGGLPDGTGKEEQCVVDPLDKFLPPPSKAKCSDELQRKINKFLEYKKAGKSFNAEVRNRKDYRNPDFLLHAVTYQEIDDKGSCFSKDVFDPHGYDPSDYYDRIEADMRRESERKEQERKKSQKIDFMSGGSQGTLSAAARINLPISGSSSTVASSMPLVPPATDAGNRDSRQNKKSKWDKVDGDPIVPLLSTGHSSVSNVGAQAALLSAANAGGGYMQYAQQKRREAEEKRSSERRSERRS